MRRVDTLVIDHPLAAARLTTMRDERTDPATFRAALRELTLMLVYEATRGLPVVHEPVTTPVGPAQGSRIAQPPLLVPVLRAGLGMAEAAFGLLPEAQMGFVGWGADYMSASTFIEPLFGCATRAYPHGENASHLCAAKLTAAIRRAQSSAPEDAAAAWAAADRRVVDGRQRRVARPGGRLGGRGDHLRGVRVVGGHDYERVLAVAGVVERDADGLVEGQRLTDLAADVRGVVALVDRGALDPQREALRVLLEQLDRLGGHLGQ